MKIRTWINIITAILLVVVVYMSRHQIAQAWHLVGGVNWIFFILIFPMQFLSYYAVGQVMFSYLHSKGNLRSMPRVKMARIALELNFVNHIIPVPSIAGFSYLGWTLSPHGVGAGRATMAQIIRFVTMFISFVCLIFVSVLFLTFDQGFSRVTFIISAFFILATIISMAILIYLLNDYKRMVNVSGWLTRQINRITKFITFGRRRSLIKKHDVDKFISELHQDYVEIKQEKKIIIKPFLWATLANGLDVALIFITFLALGFFVNPATLFVAYGISSFIAIFAATPGGSGIYEAIMITFLASAGVSADKAIAGTLLARVTLFAGTIIFGYVFYQSTINKNGRIDKSNHV